MRQITEEQVEAFRARLRATDHAPGTVANYCRHLACFAQWLGEREAAPGAAAAWRSYLLERGYTPGTINTMLVSLNRFFGFLGWNDRQVKTLRIQRRLFREVCKELTREEYQRLIAAAQSTGRERLILLMETICSTGIRVSEVKYITVEALKLGKAEISLKGKIRVILLPRKLCRKLLKYAKQQKTASGEIFLTRNGTPLSRRQIWAEMKGLCKTAGVAASKVFPHNLRHLFATLFYRACRDIVRLAYVLGHSSIETTRIYLCTTGAEHLRLLERMCLNL